ncbi:MAG: SAM-dependent methyltransferase [Bdellovibrionales bacterium]|nr:SAM-dependent methyltransferase [Bdellovibrionales bacterium]
MRSFDPKSVPKPPNGQAFDWSATQDPVVLEIGCGNGMHPLQFAKANPTTSVIAIEQTQNKFEAFEKRIAASGPIENLFAIRADAIWWCAHNLNSPACLEQIFLLYPNPNPKESQANKRFHNMPFMGFLLQFLKPGGQLHLASNISAYVEEAKTQFVSTWDLTLREEKLLNSNREPRTAFEKKYLERGETCKNLIFEKK